MWDGPEREALASKIEAIGRDPQGIVAVVGPTASGKTALAVELAVAFGGEVVSCDSVQIYRRFDIGSGKPSAEELARAPHHLVSVREPNEPIDAARYGDLAREVVADVRRRGRLPIVCGGTFLWTKALLEGLAEAPSGDEAIRARHQALAAAEGPAALHARLAEVDPTSAGRLHPNDLVRVSRALEVFELSGRPLSAWHAEHAARGTLYTSLLVGIRWSAEALTARIERRVAGMLGAGWADEVRGLLADGLGETRPMGSVGYREMRAHVAGELPEAELLPTIVRSTRVFARRQRTWLRDLPVLWLTPPEP